MAHPGPEPPQAGPQVEDLDPLRIRQHQFLRAAAVTLAMERVAHATLERGIWP